MDLIKRVVDRRIRSARPVERGHAVAPVGGRVVRWGVLPAAWVPALVLHRRFAELAGSDVLWIAEIDSPFDEGEDSSSVVPPGSERDRVLATVLFTDIVDSTATAAALGDRAWKDLLNAHYTQVRRELLRFRGREIDIAGDGFFCVFGAPARAVHCAGAIHDAAAALGIRLRAGVHTGECEVIGDKLGGFAVNMGARIAALASPGETWVSSTVQDLVTCSGLRFADRGLHAAKGVAGECRLFAVERC